MSLAVLLFAFVQWPLLCGCAVLTGMLVHWLGQLVRLRSWRVSQRPRPFVSMHYEGGVIRCVFREEFLRKHILGPQWRIAGALVAGGTCWGLQRQAFSRAVQLSVFQVHTPSKFQAPITAIGWGLPLLIGALFVILDGPVQMWGKQIKSVLQTRAERAIAEMLRDREIDGLDYAIGKIHEQFGCVRTSTYRSAIEKRLSSQTAALVYEPQAIAALVDALTEAARMEWQELSEGLEKYRAVEAEIRAIKGAATVVGEPFIESRADELLLELRELAGMVAHWRWDEFQRHLVRIKQEGGDAYDRLRNRRASSSAAVLPTGADPYHLLGVDPAAPIASIRKLRLRLAQVYHPDIGGETCNATKMAEVNAAYDAIVREREGATIKIS